MFLFTKKSLTSISYMTCLWEILSLSKGISNIYPYAMCLPLEIHNLISIIANYVTYRHCTLSSMRHVCPMKQV